MMDEYRSCDNCEYYDTDEGICTAFECNGIECPTLPCEQESDANDAITDL